MAASGPNVIEIIDDESDSGPNLINVKSEADPRKLLQVKSEADPRQLLQVKREADHLSKAGSRLQVKREAEAADPRLSKQPRSDAAPPPPPPASNSVSDLSSMIMNSLQRVAPAAPAPAPAAAQDTEVNQMLLNSLRALSAPPPAPSLLGGVPQMQSPLLNPFLQMPLLGLAGVKQEMLSGVKQEVKQELSSVKQEQTAVKAEKVEYPTEVMSAEDLANFPGVDITRMPKIHRKKAPPERAPRDLDEDSDGEGVPHRLPFGFGAIPEEVLEERQRAREEERMRAIKATQPCRFGVACKKRDCPNMHPEGRQIDTTMNPCAFGRRCKRKDCFYDHPEGRLMDDDPTRSVCKLGKRCKPYKEGSYNASVDAEENHCRG